MSSTLLAYYSPTSPIFPSSNLPSSSSSQTPHQQTPHQQGRASMPPPSTEPNGQLPTPSSSFSRENVFEDRQPSESQGESSSSIYRSSIPREYRTSSSPSTTSNIQPTQSITQELFRITQLLLSLDSDTRRSIKENDNKLENLEENFNDRFKGFSQVLDGVKELLEEEKESRNEIKGLVEGLNGRLESLEGICRSISRSQSALGITGTSHILNVEDSSVNATRENSTQFNGSNGSNDTFQQHQTQHSSHTFLALDRDRQNTLDLINHDADRDLFDKSIQGNEDVSTSGLNHSFENFNNDNLFMEIDNGFQPADMDVGIDPQDVMQPPSQILDDTTSGMRKKVAAVLAREKDVSENNDLPIDDLNDADLTQPAASSHNTRSKDTPAKHQQYNSSPDPSDSSSLTEPDDEESQVASSSKPPPRLPFPPRAPVSSSPAQPKKRGRPKGWTKPPVSSTSTQTKKKGRKSNNGTNGTNASVRPISVNSKASSEGGNQIVEDVRETSFFEPENDESPRKKRRRSNVRANSVKEEDEKKYDKAKYAKNGTARIRKFKGQVRLAERCLAASDGNRITNSSWPNKGPNTAKGRLEEIVCDVCQGRCHWSCAGIPEDKDMSQETWICPDCTYRIEEEHTPRILIETTQQLKCIRYNCILREKKALERQEGEEERYFVEKVIGRKAIAREPDSQKRIFMYLVKWDGYELFDCTWEPISNLQPHDERLLSKFEESAKRTKSNLKMKVCILPEARKFWDENTGDQIFDVQKDENSGGDENEEDDTSPQMELETEELQPPVIEHEEGIIQPISGDAAPDSVEEITTDNQVDISGSGSGDTPDGQQPNGSELPQVEASNEQQNNEDEDITMTMNGSYEEHDELEDDNDKETELPDPDISNHENEVTPLDKGKGREIIEEKEVQKNNTEGEDEIDELEDNNIEKNESEKGKGRTFLGMRIF